MECIFIFIGSTVLVCIQSVIVIDSRYCDPLSHACREIDPPCVGMYVSSSMQHGCHSFFY